MDVFPVLSEFMHCECSLYLCVVIWLSTEPSWAGIIRQLLSDLPGQVHQSHFTLLQCMFSTSAEPVRSICLFNSYLQCELRTAWVSWYQKSKTQSGFKRGMRWWGFVMPWHQLDHVHTICTSLQTSLNLYRLDALPDAEWTVSKHWRQNRTVWDNWLGQMSFLSACQQCWTLK